MFNTPSLAILITSFSLILHVQYSYKDHKKVEHKDIIACTAVLISPNTALTAAHCFEDTTGKAWVKADNDKSYSAHIIKKDDKLDIALIKIEGMDHATYAEWGTPIDKGEKVLTIGNSKDIGLLYGEGNVAIIAPDPTNNVLNILHTASILPGASGGGLFNEDGELVGINVATLNYLTFAIDETAIKPFLSGEYRN